MKRREFITLLGGAALLPHAARAQQSGAMRRIGVLVNRGADDPDGQAGVAAFQQSLAQLGWIDGRNVQIEIRWGEDSLERERKYAAELAALAPDVMLAAGSMSAAALQSVTHTLPIVFVGVIDPIGAGFVKTLAQPGGNSTGFMLFEYSLSGKWVELLKQVAPNVTHVAILHDPANPAAMPQFGALKATAESLGMDVRPISVRDAAEIESAMAAFGQSANGGLVATGSASASAYRNLIVTLAARYKLPAIYANRYNVVGGGLMCYATDRVDQFRRGAGYVSRILKGEKPAELPVQTPTKYDLVINLRTAKALGLDIPPTLLARADEVVG